jgi:hypothetical protein
MKFCKLLEGASSDSSIPRDCDFTGKKVVEDLIVGFSGKGEYGNPRRWYVALSKD